MLIKYPKYTSEGDRLTTMNRLMQQCFLLYSSNNHIRVPWPRDRQNLSCVFFKLFIYKIVSNITWVEYHFVWHSYPVSKCGCQIPLVWHLIHLRLHWRGLWSRIDGCVLKYERCNESRHNNFNKLDTFNIGTLPNEPFCCDLKPDILSLIFLWHLYAGQLSLCS